MRQTLDSHSRRRPGPFSHGAVDPGLRRTGARPSRSPARARRVGSFSCSSSRWACSSCSGSSSSNCHSVGSRCSTPSGWWAGGCSAAPPPNIPIKVNQAGVIPVVFASSLLYLPAPYAQFRQGDKFSSWISTNFVKGDHPIYILTFFLLIVFFAYFYVAITFNPNEVADKMKKYKVVARLLKRSEIDGRSDDNEETVRLRLQVYAEQTEPLLKVYRSRSLLVDVDGLGEIEEVSERVFAALEAHREGKASELIEP